MNNNTLYVTKISSNESVLKHAAVGAGSGGSDCRWMLCFSDTESSFSCLHEGVVS